jgi:geranylgeranyl diphosphate synthase type II
MFGKKIGGDILANKKTYLLVKALENSTGNVKKELLEWIHKKDFFPKEKIDAVKNIFTQVNIKEITQQKINFYFQRSTDLLNHLNIDKKTKEPFYSLGNQMLNRKN